MVGNGCMSTPAPQIDKNDDKVPFYVVDHGWHTGIIVESAAVSANIAGLPFDRHEIGFIEFGWGDQEFYRADRFSFVLAARALLFPTDSVMHVAGFRQNPALYFQEGSWERLEISQAGLARLLRHIDMSFARNDRGKLIDLGRGLYAESRFYAARQNYHVFNNCNDWIIEAISEAGLFNRTLPTLTAGSVMRQIRAYKRSLPGAGRKAPTEKYDD
ncbi:MAG: TIGR02117 family protein [Methylomicrobium sp.]